MGKKDREKIKVLLVLIFWGKKKKESVVFVVVVVVVVVVVTVVLYIKYFLREKGWKKISCCNSSIFWKFWILEIYRISPALPA